MKYAAEMGSGATIYLPNFTQIGSGTQKLIVGNTQRHGQHSDLMSLLLFFQNEECVIKNKRHESAMFNCNTLAFCFYFLM
jgi:hypothetical protein